MSLFEAVLLGLLQGLTEFLPVSSSGHLALAQVAFGWNAPGLVLEVAVHAATVVAVCVVLRREVAGLVRGALDIVRRRFKTENARLFGLVVLGTLPIAIIGLTLRDLVQEVFDQPQIAAIGLLVTGGMLLLVRFATDRDRALGPVLALVIGTAQAMAILPGISRSGSTIVVAMLLGVASRKAFNFSFLLSIPAILGATVVVLPEALGANAEPGLIGLCVTAGIAAFLSGMVALVLLRGLVRAGRLALFAPYCLALGIVALSLIE